MGLADDGQHLVARWWELDHSRGDQVTCPASQLSAPWSVANRQESPQAAGSVCATCRAASRNAGKSFCSLLLPVMMTVNGPAAGAPARSVSERRFGSNPLYTTRPRFAPMRYAGLGSGFCGVVGEVRAAGYAGGMVSWSGGCVPPDRPRPPGALRRRAHPGSSPHQAAPPPPPAVPALDADTVACVHTSLGRARSCDRAPTPAPPAPVGARCGGCAPG